MIQSFERAVVWNVCSSYDMVHSHKKNTWAGGYCNRIRPSNKQILVVPNELDFTRTASAVFRSPFKRTRPLLLYPNMTFQRSCNLASLRLLRHRSPFRQCHQGMKVGLDLMLRADRLLERYPRLEVVEVVQEDGPLEKVAFPWIYSRLVLKQPKVAGGNGLLKKMNSPQIGSVGRHLLNPLGRSGFYQKSFWQFGWRMPSNAQGCKPCCRPNRRQTYTA